MEQINHVTGVAYQGSNQDTLSHAQIKLGFKSNEWLTFLQARDRGLRVKKGSKGVHLGRLVEGEKETKEGKVKKYISMRGFTVFNIEQTEKVEEVASV